MAPCVVCNKDGIGNKNDGIGNKNDGIGITVLVSVTVRTLLAAVLPPIEVVAQYCMERLCLCQLFWKSWNHCNVLFSKDWISITYLLFYIIVFVVVIALAQEVTNNLNMLHIPSHQTHCSSMFSTISSNCQYETMFEKIYQTQRI